MRYCEALIRWNPRNNAFVQREGLCFQRMYVCLDACKKLFKYNCRPIICLNACHLKGEFKR